MLELKLISPAVAQEVGVEVEAKVAAVVTADPEADHLEDQEAGQGQHQEVLKETELVHHLNKAVLLIQPTKCQFTK